MKYMLILFCLLSSLNAAATWLDPQSIRADLRPTRIEDANITESEFQAIIKNLQEHYAPLAAKHDAKLNISGEWKNEKLNAGAMQRMGSWQVKITGGLARRPELSKDGFTLILCHELGHHFGGFVIAPGQTPFEKAWASNEGQADYFSTQVCARRIWGDELRKNAEFRQTATAKIMKACDQVWKSTDEQNLCYRILTGVESMTTTMAAIMQKPAPDYETPDTNAVAQTSHKHPAVQCRMDTALQGALCTAYFDSTIIPGKYTDRGVDSLEAEQEASSFSCTQSSGYNVGLRPTCWFKPRL